MRTQEEISARYDALKGQFMWFGGEVLLGYLDYDHAKPFLKPETTAEKWTPCERTRSDDDVLERMRDYMAFAWEKVEDHRGISAGRSVEKMTEWLWLLGDDDLVRFAEDEDNYPQYGAPVLKAICDKYGFPIPDNSMVANMSAGRECVSHCDEGCGR